ncbi:MAG TPA: hypothetical protein VIK86_04630 [Candidatus Paceibacterota bacterium]
MAYDILKVTLGFLAFILILIFIGKFITTNLLVWGIICFIGLLVLLFFNYINEVSNK